MSAIPNGMDKAIDQLGRMVYAGGKRHLENWVGGKVQQGFQAVTDRADTYLAGLKYQRFSSPMSSSPWTYGRSPAGQSSSQTQDSVNSAGRNIADDFNNVESPIGMSDGVTVGSMFVPGRGAELGAVTSLIHKPVKFKTGEHPGPLRSHDSFASMLQLYRGLKLNHAFAFKGVVPRQLNTTSLLVNRGYVHNIFRHYNHYSIGTGSSANDFYGPANADWNKSLGPDGALNRALPAQSGNATAAINSGITTAGLSINLNTPYRIAPSGTVMWSRMTQQFVENMGWTCNPDKVALMNLGSSGLLTTTNKIVYANCGDQHVTYPRSLPAQQPVYSTGGPVQSPYYYKTQCGKGKISYDFSNDGFGPVVIDVVIHKLKSGTTWNAGSAGFIGGLPSMLDDTYKNGYMRMAMANRGLVNLAGQEPVDTDPLSNARVQFMPKACLKYASNMPTTQAGTILDNPFKQVARDQFLIAAGSSRAWSFDLPALDYDARKYLTIGGAADYVLENVTDFSYIVSVAYSAVSSAVVEPSAGTVRAVIDRRPGDCNVSITGSYSEHALPVYLNKDTLTNTYTNGALDVPFYPTTAGGTNPVLAQVDIANLSQVVRSEGTASALTVVGAINTVLGA